MPPALFDLSDWTLLRVTGTDAVKFLQNFCTNDLSNAPHGCEAFFTNVKARVLGHGWLCKTDGEVWIVGTPGQGESLRAHLDRYVITEDVELADRTGSFATRFLTGTAPADPVPPLDPFETWCGGPTRVTRLDLFGGPGYLLAADDCDAGKLDPLSPDVARGTAGRFDARRILAGIPRVGVDLTDANLAPEANRPEAISYRKGCYLGQEPIARIDALGHVNRLLCRLRFEPGAAPPAAGAAVAADGKEVGTVTSSAVSQTDGEPHAVALALLKSKFTAPETCVAVGDENAVIL